MTALVLASAAAAAWAYQRLDDTDHGVLAAAQAFMARMAAPPSAWSRVDVIECVAHRAALERVYATAQRRAGRQFELMSAGTDIPEMDLAPLREAHRDLVLLVDASLTRG